jgi:hypothetical protein
MCHALAEVSTCTMFIVHWCLLWSYICYVIVGLVAFVTWVITHSVYIYEIWPHASGRPCVYSPNRIRKNRKVWCWKKMKRLVGNLRANSQNISGMSDGSISLYPAQYRKASHGVACMKRTCHAGLVTQGVRIELQYDIVWSGACIWNVMHEIRISSLVRFAMLWAVVCPLPAHCRAQVVWSRYSTVKSTQSPYCIWDLPWLLCRWMEWALFSALIYTFYVPHIFIAQGSLVRSNKLTCAKYSLSLQRRVNGTMCVSEYVRPGRARIAIALRLTVLAMRSLTVNGIDERDLLTQ